MSLLRRSLCVWLALSASCVFPLRQIQSPSSLQPLPLLNTSDSHLPVTSKPSWRDAEEIDLVGYDAHQRASIDIVGDIIVYQTPPPRSPVRGYDALQIKAVRDTAVNDLLIQIAEYPRAPHENNGGDRDANAARWDRPFYRADFNITSPLSALVRFPAPYRLDKIHLRLVPNPVAMIAARNVEMSKKLATQAVKTWRNKARWYGMGCMKLEIWEWDEGSVDWNVQIPRGWLEVEMVVWGWFPPGRDWNT